MAHRVRDRVGAPRGHGASTCVARVEERRWWRASRHCGWLSVAGLLLALSSLFLFSGDRERFYRSQLHDWNSARWLASAENLSWRGLVFEQTKRKADGTLRYDTYQRFPLGGYVLIKLAILLKEGDLSAQILIARMLMLAAFCAAAVLAYLALWRLLGSRAAALGATLLAFSSYHMLRYSDMICSETSPDLFAVLLVFHGMVLFEQERRLGQLLAKVCVALLIGWHVWAVLVPFVASGLACEGWRAWRGGAAPGSARSLVRRGRAAAGVLRGPYALTGLVVVVVTVGVIASNLAVERAAFEGARTLTEVPGFRSLVWRMGWDGSGDVSAVMTQAAAWPNFLAGQFHRVGAMLLPYAVPAPRDDLGELPWAASEGASLAWLGVVGAVLAFGGLALAQRRRMLAILALTGFCWAFPMRYQTAEPTHDYEAMFFLGVPLVLFALVLRGVARVAGRRRGGFAAGLVVAAAIVFGFSSYRMAEAGADAESAAWDNNLLTEFEAIRGVIDGKDVLVAVKQDAVYRFVTAPTRLRVRAAYGSTVIDDRGRMIFSFLVGGAIMRYADPLGETAARGGGAPPDFVLAFERFALPSLYTPGHRTAFLYDSADAIEAVVRARRQDYRAIAATEFAAAAPWRVYTGSWTGEPAIAYLREPCAVRDFGGRFFLHVLPRDEAAAPPNRTLANGYVQERVVFADNGLRFDNKCMMRLPAPDYGMAAVYTGQYGANRGPLLWRTAFYVDMEGLRRAYRLARSSTPAARGRFDVYLAARQLIYVREPCAQPDVERRMFLHFVPTDPSDLPKGRGPSGFENADFAFRERGALFDERCVATVPLPDYPLARVYTGQFGPSGAEIWRVEFDRAR